MQSSLTRYSTELAIRQKNTHVTRCDTIHYVWGSWWLRNPDREVQALDRVISSCSWERQYTLTGLLCTQVYKEGGGLRLCCHAANQVKKEPCVTRNMDYVIFQVLTTGYEVLSRVPPAP